jgi:hypothetical protein
MATRRASFAGTKGGAIIVRLKEGERKTVVGLAAEYRELLKHESQATDAAVARLFPPAYREDPLRNFDYERHSHDGLMTERLAAINTLEQTADAKTLTIEQAHTWLGVLNDLRLVLGTHLDIAEDSALEDFVQDPQSANAFAIYLWLTELVGTMIEALDPSLADLSETAPPEDPTA